MTANGKDLLVLPQKSGLAYALDPDNESIIYNALIERLPNAAIVSVAHRKTLEAFHDQTLFIERAVEREAA